MADDLGERTEDPTSKRLSEAREEGNVAKSPDLAGSLLLLGATLGMWVAAVTMLSQGRSLLGKTLDFTEIADPLLLTDTWQLARFVGAAALWMAAPLLLVAWATGALAHLVQIGWIFSTKAARPNFRKLNPMAGLKRIVGIQGVVKSGMDVFKVALVVGVAVFTIAEQARAIVVLPYLAGVQAVEVIGEMMLMLALRVLAVLLVLGILDFMYQKWKHHRDLKMTKQQVKDEMRQSEGDPEVKRRRLRMQRQIALQRISSAVPKADVVVTNPEHLAVAIQYDADTMHAPKVVAKGADYMAMRIRQLAMQHGIPIVERKPLARALYKEVAVNQEVPPAFYKAVAEILAYVYRLGGRKPVGVGV